MKSKRVRLAVVVNQRGEWYAMGGDEFDEKTSAAESAMYVRDDCLTATHFIECDVPLPIPVVLQGEVKPTESAS